VQIQLALERKAKIFIDLMVVIDEQRVQGGKRG
jgi:hypothetical protein